MGMFMGMYSGLKMAITIKDSTPVDILNALDLMLGNELGQEKNVDVDHPLFSTPRW